MSKEEKLKTGRAQAGKSKVSNPKQIQMREKRGKNQNQAKQSGKGGRADPETFGAATWELS